ncbi:MAG: hypothetical protein OXG95_06325 [Chloroflexi bacterium]|nr:hypothetical protein [Chloroflexota bacterium]
MTDMRNPFDDLTNGDMPDQPLDGEVVDNADLADAERFAEILDRMDAGGGVDLDPREDPTLAALTTVAAQLQDSARDATSTPRFESYRARSRDYLLGRIERERAAVAASAPPAEPAREEPRGVFGIPLLRWTVLAPVASAAAAAALVLAFVVATDGGASAPVEPQTAATVDPPSAQPVADDDADEQDAVEPVGELRAAALDILDIFEPVSNRPSEAELDDLFTRATEVRQPESTVAVAPDDTPEDAPVAADAAPDPEVVPPPTVVVAPSPVTQRPTPRTVPAQLDHIETLLSELTVKVDRQEHVPAQLLREITESIAAVAYRIEASPDQVTHAQVVAYIHAAADGRFLLAAAVADEADETALNAARRVAQDGVVVAGWYLKYR